MSDTAEPQVPVTPTVDQNGGNPVTPSENGGNGTTPTLDEVYKTFKTKEEFDNHSAGILNSAKAKAEKELLAMLGLKPDEKDKLQKFKESYEASLTEAEKQAKNLEESKEEISRLKNEVAEKDAIISALGKLSGKSTDDVMKYVKMAKGLVDDETTIDQAIEQVFSMTKKDEPKVPSGTPLNTPNPTPSVNNPFQTGNLTEQGNLIKTDRVKAREMYMAVFGKAPNW